MMVENSVSPQPMSMILISVALELDRVAVERVRGVWLCRDLAGEYALPVAGESVVGGLERGALLNFRPRPCGDVAEVIA